MKLKGKRALVTGASTGIGEAIAHRLAADGAVVGVHGRNVERTEAVVQAISAAGGYAFPIIGSLSGESEALKVADAAEKALGGVDILVNNAGGESAGGGHSQWFDATADDWLATYESNVVSMVVLIRRFAPLMRDRGWGRLIQLSSTSVDRPMTQIPDYSAAKAAIRTLTRSVAHSLAQSGVTSNSVSPGLIVTPNVRNYVLQTAEQQGWGGTWEEVERRAAVDLIPSWAGRLGYPEDIAATVAFLASPEAQYVNAIDIRVDGGRL